MARIPFYEPQTQFSAGPRADPATFGAGMGQAMAQAGDVLAQIGERMQRREDAIASTHAAREQDRWLTESRRATETEDLVKKRTFDDWKSAAEAHKQQLLNNYTGSPRGRGALDQQLTNQLYQHEKALREQQHKAQIGMLTEFIEDEKNKLAIEVGFAPEMLGTAFDSFDDRVDQYEGVLPTELLESYKKSARGALVQTAVSQLEAQGRFDEARAVLTNPDFGNYLPPDVSRRLTIGVAAGQAKQDIEARKREANVQSWAMAMGVDPENMTPQQRMLAENASTQTMNYVEKINLATMLNGGQPLSPEVRDRILKTDRAGTRTQVQDLISQMPAFESGRMSDDERAAFLVQAEKVFPTQYRLNQANGQQEPIPNSGGIAKLAETIGRPIGGAQPRQPAPGVPIGGTPAGASGDMGMDNSFIDDQGRTDFRALPPQPGEPGFVGEVDEAAQVIGAAPMTEQAGGLWNLADRIAGPVAGVRRGIGGGPVDIGIGQQEVAAAQEVQLQQRNLVRALQQNPRYAEGERKDIAVSISIEPEVLSNPTAYRTRLIQIGRYVQEEIAYQTSVLNQPAAETTVEMRKQAMQAIPLFQKFQERLGLPPTVRTPEEALKMRPRPPQVLTPDGRLLDVPQE